IVTPPETASPKPMKNKKICPISPPTLVLIVNILYAHLIPFMNKFSVTENYEKRLPIQYTTFHDDYLYFLNTKDTLCPPKPNELLTTALTSCSLDWFGT